MEITELLTAMASTGIVSIGGAYWLCKTLIERRLDRNDRKHEAELSRKLKEHGAAVEAGLKKEVETYLGEQNAERQYRMDAKKRLYSAIGPLRFQLSMACAEYANRVARMCDGKSRYDTSLTGYFGRSTAYRLLRTLAVSELIERQIAYADFAIDPATRGLLRFKQRAFLCLSSHQVSLDHPDADWSRQRQHAFYDVLTMIASAMIVDEGEKGARALRFDEFMQTVETDGLSSFAPLPDLLSEFSPEKKPILWLRLLALARLCIGFVEANGRDLGLEIKPIDSEAALDLAGDRHIAGHREIYLTMLQDFGDSFVGA
jgi:hypothetical protein